MCGWESGNINQGGEAMKTRFYNARLLTLADGMNVTEGEVWVEGNRITHVGTGQNQPVCWDREIDVKGNLLMPGFKNAHTHSAMTFLRSKADDLPLEEWLHKQVFPLEAKLTGEDVYHLSKLAIMEYLTSGITSNFDMYFFPEMIAKASVDCGFRTNLVSPITSFGSMTLEDMEEEYHKYNHYHELISYTLGFHAEYSCETPLLEGIAKLSRKLKAPVFDHNSETKTSVEQCIERTGMTPTAFLDSLGMYEYGGGGYHCIYMAEEDLEIFRKKQLIAVTNPGSNTKLASGIADISRMVQMGIPVAIGTDGPASNNCLDMFREMFLVTGLAKLKTKDASAVDADLVLQMAVQGGARAMALTDCDMLAPGKLADIIMIDLQQPNMRPIHNISKNLVYSGSKSNVRMTMINGRILYEDGKYFIGEEPDEIYRQADLAVERLMG